MFVLPDEKMISEAMQELYRKWAERQKKINWQKRGQEVEEEIEDIEKILKGGQKKKLF